MTNYTDITLAMDLSLTSPGFAVLAVFEGKPISLEVGHIKTKGKTHGAKLVEISDEVTHYLAKYKPKHIVRERSFSRFPAATQAIYKVNGVVDYTLEAYAEVYNTPNITNEIAVTSVKKLVTGGGKASKQDVEKAVIKLLQIEQVGYFANDDESDAAAVGIAYLKQEGLIE